jgi:hypothetical protein
MCKKVLLVFLVISFMINVDGRTGGNFGLGLVIGDPTGLSFKNWLSSNTAISGAAAIGFGWGRGDVGLHLHLSHLWHNFSLIPVKQGALPLYLGVGGRITINGFALGVRGCGGMAYHVQGVPLDIFLELGIVVDVIREGGPGPDADLGLGLRYYF